MTKLILFSLLLLPAPAQALTWKEFWEPFTYERHYYYPAPPPPPPIYYEPLCTRKVVRREYVQGYWINQWNYREGYWRQWTERERVPCYSLRH